MELTISRRDIIVSVVAIVGFASWIAYANYDNAVIRSELEAIAEVHLNSMFENPGLEVSPDDYDYLAIVDSRKAFTLFGRGWGVVHCYYKEKDDPDYTTFEGVEYYYTRRDGEWKLIDSSGCSAKSHHLRAFDAFMDAGIDAPNSVFNVALGLPNAESGTFDHLGAERASEHEQDR